MAVLQSRRKELVLSAPKDGQGHKFRRYDGKSLFYTQSAGERKGLACAGWFRDARSSVVKPVPRKRLHFFNKSTQFAVTVKGAVLPGP